MKNRLTVMFFTFLIMVAVTPLVFSKLMNAKFNKMLEKLKADGIEITLKEDRSGYLKTDKIFAVKIPAAIMGYGNIAKRLDLVVETEFKNLPVTNVVFKGKMEKILLNAGYEDFQKFLNGYLKDKIKFFITTPNFKTYVYKLDDIEINKDISMNVKNIKGSFKYSDTEMKNRYEIKNVALKFQNFVLELNDIKSDYLLRKKDSYSKITFNLKADAEGLNIDVKNISLNAGYKILNKLNIFSVAKFDILDIKKILTADNFVINTQIDGLDYDTVKELASVSKEIKNKYIDKLFEKGFDIKFVSKLSSVMIPELSKKIEGFDINVNIKVLPTKDALERIKKKDYGFINATLDFTLSPELETLIMSFVPQSSFIFALAQKKNSKVKLNLELKNGQLYSDGEPVKR